MTLDDLLNLLYTKPFGHEASGGLPLFYHVGLSGTSYQNAAGPQISAADGGGDSTEEGSGAGKLGATSCTSTSGISISTPTGIFSRSSSNQGGDQLLAMEGGSRASMEGRPST